jgi:hypothetical protein
LVLIVGESIANEDLLEHRDDLSQLLLNGLPPDERKHVIDIIRQGDEEKLRYKRAQGAEESVPAQGESDEDDLEDENFSDATD